jgi:RNA polymerase sigma-70 factor (ECF subfamily)
LFVGALRLVRSSEAPASAARPSGTPSDDELIEAVKRHDERVAGQLYDKLVDTVDRTLWRIFGRREHDHEDLVQSTFEQIVSTLSKNKFAGACSLTTWASTVASHVGLNALRSRRRERNVIDRKIENADRAQRADADVQPDLEKLRDALVRIDPVKAETVVLHDILGHELAEIAVLMNTTVAAAQSRLVRGRRELAEQIEGGAR